MDVNLWMIDEEFNALFCGTFFSHNKKVKDNNTKNCNVVVKDE